MQKVYVWMSRIGGGLALAGVIAILVTGGDPEAVVSTAEKIVTAGGVIIAAAKEIIQTVVNWFKK